MPSPSQPVYVIQIISGSTTKATFSSGGTNKIISLSLKPGLTNTIGDFELTVPDISGSLENPGAFKNILPFEDVKFALGYTNTGSTNFAGKIEIIQSGLNKDKGYYRTFIGSDYGECLTRVLVNRAFNNLSGDTIIQGLRNQCTGSTVGNLSTSNDFMAGDSTTYSGFVMSNEEVSRGMKQYADKASMDFYVDVNKVFHLIARQSQTGSETLTVGQNIIDYTKTTDLNTVKNDIYVFGIHDSSNISGSDDPTNHDEWTELTTSGWTGSFTANGTPQAVTVDTGSGVTGSYSIYVITGEVAQSTACILDLRKNFSSAKFFKDGDKIHFFYGSNMSTLTMSGGPSYEVRLETTTSDYFSTSLESTEQGWTTGATEKLISLGPTNEGTSTLGTYETNTGSYKWTRTGTPDWYNINSIRLILSGYISPGPMDNIKLYIDGLYFETPFKAHASGSSSIIKYGLRRYTDSSESYNSSQYCSNVASTLTGSLLEPTTQIEVTTTGSVGFVMGSVYQLVLPADSINGYYQLIDLEHIVDSDGFKSKCVFTDKKELRTLVPTINYSVQQSEQYTTYWDVLKKHFAGVRGVSWLTP